MPQKPNRRRSTAFSERGKGETPGSKTPGFRRIISLHSNRGISGSGKPYLEQPALRGLDKWLSITESGLQICPLESSCMKLKRSEIIFSLIQIPLDFILILLAGLGAYALRFSGFVSRRLPIMFELPYDDYSEFLSVVAAFCILFFALAGLYQLKVTRSLVYELFLVVLSVTAGVVAVALWMFFAAQPFESRLIIFFWWALAIIFVSLGRIMLRRIQQVLMVTKGIGLHNVLLIGHPSRGLSSEFLTQLKRNPGLGFKVVGEVSDINIPEVTTLVKSQAVDDIFLTDLAWNEEQIFELVQFAHRMQVNFSFVPSLFTAFRTDLRPLTSGLAILEVKHTPLEGWGSIIKRMVDVVGSLVGLILLGVLFPFVAFAIKLETPGPVIIGLTRIREGGKPFTLYKFRSMVKNAHELKFTELKEKNERKDSPLFKIKDDPRITRVGHFLRRFRIDELPNFVNVLKGEMSLVGPRPHEPEEVERYKKHHLQVLSIRPGVTGLAQISGSSNLPFDREVELDTYYIEHWSLLFDLYVLMRTIAFIFIDKSAV